MCPAGGGHDDSGSGDYSLSFAGETVDPNLVQIDPDEFPALARWIYFFGDIDGYLRHLGIDPTGVPPVDVS